MHHVISRIKAAHSFNNNVDIRIICDLEGVCARMRYSGYIDLQATRGNPVDLDFDACLTRNFFGIAL